MPKKSEQTNVQYTTMPNSVEAEQNVLCCVMRNVEIQLEILGELSADDFYQPNHATIFDTMKEVARGSHVVDDQLVANTVNFTTVVDALRRGGNLAKVGDIDYMLHLNDLLPSTAKYKEYIAIVKRAATMRRLINVCGDITKIAYSSASAEEALSQAEEAIFHLSQHGSNSGLVNLGETTSNVLETISRRFRDPDNFMGLQTGFKQFDKLTNGLHPGELIVLAARPGVGKSAMAMNIAENVAKSKKTVAVFSLEMSNEQIVERLLSSMSAVTLESIKSGRLQNSEADLDRLLIAQNVIASMNLYGSDFASIKPSEILSQCRRLQSQHGLDLVIIDYIQLMNSDASGLRDESRQNQVANITRALKLMAKELKIPVIALSQLKRDAEIRNIKGEKTGSSEPVLSDLRESGAIEQDADIVMFIHKDVNSTSGTASYSLIVAKHRNGETANIPLYWIGKTVRFADEDYMKSHNISMGSVSQEKSEDNDTDNDSEEIMNLGEAPEEDSEDSSGGFVMDNDVEDNDNQE